MKTLRARIHRIAAIFWLTMVITLVFGNVSYSQNAPDIIDSISPASVEAGTIGLTVTVTLQDLGTPPVPPSEVPVTALEIGSLEGRNIIRDNLTITAVFDIPAGESNGLKRVSLTFPGPDGNNLTFTRSNLFEVTGGTGGVDPGDPVDVTGNAGDLPYPIVDTGQDLCYDASGEITMPAEGAAFYGQDGQINGYQPDYSVSADGLTVTDNVTGLTWTRKADWNGDGQVDADDKFTHAEALAYVATVNAQFLGGYSDWRAPTIKELYSLIDYRGTDPNVQSSSSLGLTPFIDDDVFEFGYGDVDAGDRIIDSQWVTTSIYVGTVMGGQEAFFGVNFADGRIKGYPTTGGPGGGKTYYLRLCRGNTAYGQNDLTDNGNGTVTDAATGLMWTQEDNGEGVNWEDALAYAQDKNAENHLGYSDWRLPDAKELQSLVDYIRSPDTHGTAAIDPVFNATQITNSAGQADYPFYWSGTTFLSANGSAERAVYVAFGRGLGSMDGTNVIDVHGAGCQRSDPKDGDAALFPSWGNGPQGDVQRVFNHVRLVRTVAVSDTSGSDDPGNASDGVTLFAPMNHNTTYLMDEDEAIIKTWESRYGPGLSCYLLDDKSLLRTGRVGPSGNNVFGSTGGSGGVVERYDWDGNLTWSFEHNSDDYLLHHDIEYLPGGNILMIAWERKSEAEAVAAGRNPSLLSGGELWPDKIIEVNAGGEIVWEWHVWDHLIQEYDASKSDYGTVSEHPGKIDLNYVQGRESADWTHINAVDYHAGLDQILLTVHNFSEIWIVDHNTTTTQAAGAAGDLLYRWGNPQAYGRGGVSDQTLFVPHDGRWFEDGLPGAGDILVFNNGQNRPDGNYSTVDQITPPLREDGCYNLSLGSIYGPVSTIWMYRGNPAADFYASHISGAQRLESGNTLICDGPAGTFFEVSNSGELVWEYVNPYTSSTPQGETNEVFRAVRYDLESMGSSTGPVDGTLRNATPSSFALHPNHPNPFNPVTSISFTLPDAADVKLAVFNMRGEKIKSLLDGNQAAGHYEVTWDGTDESGMKVASGLYICRITAGNRRAVRKMSLMK